MNKYLLTFRKIPNFDELCKILNKTCEAYYLLHDTCIIIETNYELLRIRTKIMLGYAKCPNFIIVDVSDLQKNQYRAAIETGEFRDFKMECFIEDGETIVTQEMIDHILDKISEKGISSITEKEKKIIENFQKS